MNKEDFVLPLLNGKEWAGEHMQIEAEPRAKVVFHGAFRAQVNWGSGKTDPNGLLTLGETYVVKQVDIHGSYTNVQVEGFSQWFPSGCFHDLKDDGPEQWKVPKEEV